MGNLESALALSSARVERAWQILKTGGFFEALDAALDCPHVVGSLRMGPVGKTSRHRPAHLFAGVVGVGQFPCRRAFGAERGRAPCRISQPYRYGRALHRMARRLCR